MLALLIAAGANVDTQSKASRPELEAHGRTALLLAIEGGHSEMAAQLIAADANPNTQDNVSTSALDTLRGGQHGTSAMFLLKASDSDAT